ncbi:trypsin alpha-like [Drosophila biarmipes]|uniref:trypsin alpha-like n=1 Tax=Drosophila biarmipes TaxID=125945 RepID=UPI0007E8059A|nr:trypsin alpha-like [Drosophila biarmipes]
MFFSCFLLLLATNVLSAGRVPQPEERIIGGKEIEIEQAPWQVSLQIQGKHKCGGSIYSKDIIITAAHCFFTKDGKRLEAEDFKVRAGTAMSNSGGIVVEVAAIRAHEVFKMSKFKYDIGLMRLSEPLEFTNKVQPIPLAEWNPPRGSPAFSSGWGASFVENNPFKGYVQFINPIHLQGVRLLINSSGYSKLILHRPKDTISAGSNTQTTCRGDSGGPLVVNQQLVGVVSYGPGRCRGAGSFTSVPYFREWILNTIETI